jgi:hypothetical protein
LEFKEVNIHAVPRQEVVRILTALVDLTGDFCTR